MNPDVKRRLQQEVDAVLEGRLPTYDDMKDLVYAQQVLKESLRMHPPIPAVARDALTDFEAQGFQFKKGWRVLLNITALHQNVSSLRTIHRATVLTDGTS